MDRATIRINKITPPYLLTSCLNFSFLTSSSTSSKKAFSASKLKYGLFPFLFVTYLCLEYIEHKTSDKTAKIIKKAGWSGPLVGSICGALPQCGFSVVAANFFAARVIGIGTLLAIFLSTSDEMIPIFISSSVAPGVIGRILALKFFIALISGIAVDAAAHVISYGFHADKHIHDLCERDNCGCEEDEGGVIHSALIHTIKITAFVFVVSLILSLLIGFAGRDAVASLMTGSPLIGSVITAFIGLVPNCAASVVITQMYLEGLLTAGQLMTGLLVGAGVGLLVLVRTNNHYKENAAVIATLLLLGIVWGTAIDMLGISL
jgi:hypothetical protein